MHIIKIDPRALKDNPDDARKSKSTPQGDALLAAIGLDSDGIATKVKRLVASHSPVDSRSTVGA